MIQVYYSLQSRMITPIMKKKIKERMPEQDEMNLVKLDMGNATIGQLIDECSYLPLGYERKTVIAENCYFLSEDGAPKKKRRGKKNVSEDEESSNEDPFLEYINNPNPDIDLYLLAYVDEPSGVYVDALQKAGASINGIKKMDDAGWIQYINNYFAKRGIKITSDAVRELKDRTNEDYSLLLNESNKLVAYSLGEEITLDTVKLLVSEPIEEDVFALSDALIKGKVKEAISIYRDLKKKNANEVTLLNLLFGQFKFLHQVSVLKENGDDYFSIANTLGVNQYRAKIAFNNLRKMHPSDVENWIEGIYKCQVEIMSGRSAPQLAFERYICSFSK